MNALIHRFCGRGQDRFCPVRTSGTINLCFLLLLAALLSQGCASFKPAPASYQPQLARAETKTNGPIVASVAVLGRDEAATMFGLPLHKKHIQPVWVRIQNLGTNSYYFLPASLDPAYYSPGEVAYTFRKSCAGSRNRRVLQFVEDKHMPQSLKPHEVIEGFVFTTTSRGAKHLLIDLLCEKDFRRLEFFTQFPDKRYDLHAVDFETIYPQEVVRDYSLGELPAVLEALPATTTDASTNKAGDPINLVVIGDRGQFSLAFGRQGWDLTEVLTFGNVFNLIGSFLFNKTWETSPVSPLFLFGRKQDFALQKARSTIHERNHLRLWLAPFTCEGRIVFVGQISRDIGLRFTFKAPGWVTHKIDPEVDEARNYLTQEMLTSHSVESVAWVGGVGEASREQPGHNLTGDPFSTDGLRVVLFLSPKPVGPSEVHFSDWRSHTSSGSN